MTDTPQRSHSRIGCRHDHHRSDHPASTSSLAIWPADSACRRRRDDASGRAASFDFNTAAGFMESGGWRPPKFAVFMGDRGGDSGRRDRSAARLADAIGGLRGDRGDGRTPGRSTSRCCVLAPHRSTCRGSCWPIGATTPLLTGARRLLRAYVRPHTHSTARPPGCLRFWPLLRPQLTWVSPATEPTRSTSAPPPAGIPTRG